MRRLSIWVATLLGSGFFPFAPATFASGLTVLAVWLFWPVNQLLELILIAVLTPIAIVSANEAEKELGHDASPIVIDEVAGQLIAVWGMPRELGWMVAGFFLFRFFDIVKPLGVGALQNLPGGVGIVADDLLAGLYSWLVLIVFYFVFQTGVLG